MYNRDYCKYDIFLPGQTGRTIPSEKTYLHWLKHKLGNRLWSKVAIHLRCHLKTFQVCKWHKVRQPNWMLQCLQEHFRHTSTPNQNWYVWCASIIWSTSWHKKIHTGLYEKWMWLLLNAMRGDAGRGLILFFIFLLLET